MDLVESVDLTGRQIGQYAVLSQIGSGGMGTVYWARDERLRRDVAIKVAGCPLSTTEEARRSLLSEARALSRLNHPHVAGIYDFLTEAGQDVIVMEFVPGATLKDVLSGGPLPPAEVVRLGGQMVRGLAAAHAAKVIHQDIKPANLKVTSSGELKILDFGVATFLPGGTTETTSDSTSGFGLAGTVPYMAPERLSGEPVDERSDIFSAGAVLYEMASARRAFPQTQIACLFEAVLHGQVPLLATVNPLVPPALDRVVMKAIEKHPRDRHQSATELADELDKVMTTARPNAAPVAGPSCWWAAFAS